MELGRSTVLQFSGHNLVDNAHATISNTDRGAQQMTSVDGDITANLCHHSRRGGVGRTDGLRRHAQLSGRTIAILLRAPTRIQPVSYIRAAMRVVVVALDGGATECRCILHKLVHKGTYERR